MTHLSSRGQEERLLPMLNLLSCGGISECSLILPRVLPCFLDALLHCAIFSATCLAMLEIVALQVSEVGC